jgi:hypothetical protein
MQLPPGPKVPEPAATTKPTKLVQSSAKGGTLVAHEGRAREERVTEVVPLVAIPVGDPSWTAPNARPIAGGADRVVPSSPGRRMSSSRR